MSRNRRQFRGEYEGAGDSVVHDERVLAAGMPVLFHGLRQGGPWWDLDGSQLV